MEKLVFFLAAVYLTVSSCTKEKTDYQAEIETVVTEHTQFKEATSFSSGEYTISIEALNGTFYKGYNEIRLKIKNIQRNASVIPQKITFLPILTKNNTEKTSCPHAYDLVYNSEDEYFSGYAVFTDETNNSQNWDIYISYIINQQTNSAQKSIAIQEQPNKNLQMTSFRGIDNEQYFIALLAPQKPSVSENKLIAGIYKLNKPKDTAVGNFPDPAQFSYSTVNDYTLRLDPRMPESSMGNHSSPNNKDLIQQSDGHYHGIVNYTMTGNWTLNFIMLNQNGRIIRGTEVSKDFTPGVEGVKSELHIDVLF